MPFEIYTISFITGQEEAHLAWWFRSEDEASSFARGVIRNEALIAVIPQSRRTVYANRKKTQISEIVKGLKENTRGDVRAPNGEVFSDTLLEG